MLLVGKMECLVSFLIGDEIRGCGHLGREMASKPLYVCLGLP